MTTKKLTFNPKLYMSILFLALGSTANFSSSAAIQRWFPSRLPIYDTLFTILPYWPWTQDFSDWANIFSFILLWLYLFPNRAHKAPFAFTAFGFGYLLRSILILLNPFGGPLGNVTHYGLTTVEQHGQFPSGHVFFVTLVYYLISSDAPILKKLALLSIPIEVAALLLSHGHYSIDIVGGLFLGFFVYHFLAKYQSLLTS